MSLAANLVLAIVLLVAGFAGGIKWHAGQDAIEAQQAQETQREKERADRKSVDFAAVGHEQDKAQIRTITKTVIQEVEHVIREPFYVDGSCFDDAGLRQLAIATGAALPASQPASAVPAAKPAR